jgi:hypothetical protein
MLLRLSAILGPDPPNLHADPEQNTGKLESSTFIHTYTQGCYSFVATSKFSNKLLFHSHLRKLHCTNFQRWALLI